MPTHSRFYVNICFDLKKSIFTEYNFKPKYLWKFKIIKITGNLCLGIML